MTGAKPNRTNTYTVRAIGVARTPYREEAPYQPAAEADGRFQVVLDPEFEDGLRELERFRYMYVLAYLGKGKSFEEDSHLVVRPPWAEGAQVGLFASRSPRRPSPIGLSVVRVLSIHGNVIETGPMDLFDGTPILDIKPYVAHLDSKEDANLGWIDDAEGRDHLILHIRGIPHEHD